MAATVVLVHGGWGRPDDWDLVVEALGESGVSAVTVDLPTCALADADVGDDIAAVTTVLDAVDGRAVLVGHSYGGVPITAAGTHPAVDRLVYVGAFLVAEGETPMTLLGGTGSTLEEEGALGLDDEGRVFLTAWAGDEMRDRVGDDALQLMRARPRRPMSIQPADEEQPVAWRERPATLVRTIRDQALPGAVFDKMAERADEVVTIDTDHFPMFEAPGELASILAARAAASH